MRSIVIMLGLCLTLSACDLVDAVKEGLAQTEQVAGDLEQAVGSKPAVGFNWINGSLKNVNVTFQGVPTQKTLQQIIDLSGESITKRFKTKPEQVVVSFAVAGK